MSETCLLCGSKNCKIETAPFHDAQRINCKDCYRFFINDSVTKGSEADLRKRYGMIYEFLLKNGDTKGTDLYLFFYQLPNDPKRDNPMYIDVSELMKNYPKNVGAKLDRILLNLAIKYPNIGDDFRFEELPHGLLFLETCQETELCTLLEYMQDAKFFTVKNEGSFHRCKLTAKAWERINELGQRSDVNNKDVFVAMSFSDETSPTREAIRKAIENSTFSASFMDEIIHNKQIVPEMLRFIKESRFLIMDISDPNYGAYYEAGYAAGMGKEVIITCKEDIFNKKDYGSPLEEKAFKPHFDIAQKQILRWKDEGDLTKQLEQWIKHLF